jgi:rhodanese-related sulfurtransferase/thioredoxin-related protein
MRPSDGLRLLTRTQRAFARVFFGAIVSLAAWQCHAAELTWLTDLPKAQAQANAERKSVLLFFHGSDWCPPCLEIQRQVIDSPEFIAYARKALVLVDVDFPENTKQSDELKQANLALKTRFNVGENFPTLVLLDDSGNTLFQEAGYNGGGPADVLPNLQRHAKPPASTADTAGYKDLSVAEFAKMAANKQDVILDVRTTKEFAAGHIAGAVNLDVMSSDFEARAAALDKTKIYLVHCASGVRSVRACEKLEKLDFPHLYNLPGGFRAWVRAGEPVEK